MIFMMALCKEGGLIIWLSSRFCNTSIAYSNEACLINTIYAGQLGACGRLIIFHHYLYIQIFLDSILVPLLMCIYKCNWGVKINDT